MNDNAKYNSKSLQKYNLINSMNIQNNMSGHGQIGLSDTFQNFIKNKYNTEIIKNK